MKRAIIPFLSLLMVLVFSTGLFGATDRKTATASITAQNTFTDSIKVKQHGIVRISGTWVATVSLQRSDDDTTWYDTGDTWTANGVFSFTDFTNAYYRVGVKASGFTSGTVGLYIGTGN